MARAKRFARAQGTSVSQLVEKMLDLAASPSERDAGSPPILTKLRGSMPRGTVRDYHRYLEQKYR